MAEPRLREATDEDISAILDVMRAALGEPPGLRRTPELFNWKHIHNPFGRSLILVAEVDGRIAGVRAFMRWDLTTGNGDTVRCGRAVDTATHPDFQGMGIFRKLTMAALDLAKEHGIDLIFNTPNEKSAPGYLKMGWSEVGWIGPMVRPRLGRVKGDDSVTLDEVIPTATAFEPQALRRGSKVSLSTSRTPEYQEWRFGSHPTARYGWWANEATGVVVRPSVRRGRVELAAVDFGETINQATFRSLARSHRARYVASAFTPAARERAVARSAGWFTPPGQKGLRLVANPLSDLSIDVFDIASWDFTLGDLELL